ncbi:MAG: tetratricopeptide repeat protein [Gammaproteobacteria bacterium]
MNQLTTFWMTIISVSLIAIVIILIPLWRKKIRLALILTALVVLIIPTIAILLYLHWGSSDSLTKYYQIHDSQKTEQKLVSLHQDPNALISRMKATLAKDPQSEEGWYLLGRLYFSQNDYENSYNSFTKAYQLNPKSLIIQLGVAESSFLVNQQRLTPQTKQLLYAVLQNVPDQPDALNLMAIDAFHQKQFAKAINYWERMSLKLPADSHLLPIVKQAIAMAHKQINDRKVK